MTAADFDRALIDALGTPTAVELERELALLAALDAHRQRVADACAGRPTLAIGTATYGVRRG